MTPTMVSHAVMQEHYGGLSTSIVENFMAEVLKEIWSQMLSTSILKVTSLKVIFRLIELSDRSLFITNLEHIDWTVIFARHTVNLVPMLALLFDLTRMHALQIDPKHGRHQRRA